VLLEQTLASAPVVKLASTRDCWSAPCAETTSSPLDTAAIVLVQTIADSTAHDSERATALTNLGLVLPTRYERIGYIDGCGSCR